MDKFTVKDFITYNNPCFSCSDNIIIKVGATLKGAVGHVYLRPTVDTDKLEITLKENYSNTLKLQIWHKSNTILVSNEQRIKNYLNDHKLFLHSRCSKCATIVISRHLEFNLNKGFVRPVALSSEDLRVRDGDSFYQICSNFEIKKSIAYISKLGGQTIDIKMPLSPLSKFKTRDRFLDKLKTYVLFS